MKYGLATLHRWYVRHRLPEHLVYLFLGMMLGVWISCLWTAGLTL